METENSMDLKVEELLKEVQLEYSPALTKFVDDAVSSIKQAIDTIPEDLKVRSFSDSLLLIGCQ
jgi:U3 small nucleolar RNA-associated protein 22